LGLHVPGRGTCAKERVVANKKVYIIDDDRDIVESMSIVLKKNNYEVSAQYDDENVEENVKKARPDLVILDVMFPEDSSAGFSIARKLKGNVELKAIPILMLSAINERGIYVGKFSGKDIDDSFLPVNTFLEKPVKPVMLLERVAALIGK
jgi:DNA-binding response OmpR family regulator